MLGKQDNRMAVEIELVPTEVIGVHLKLVHTDAMFIFHRTSSTYDRPGLREAKFF
jgi:hypothetical protein